MSSSPSFPPIAIVGQGCVLPGALDPEALWSLVRAGRSALSPGGTDRWRLDAHADRTKLAKEVASDVGGHVTGFESVFDPQGFALPAASLRGLDAVFTWPLHAAREALRSAGLGALDAQPRGTVVLGNLSYPTPGLVDLALETWSGAQRSVDARNRFMSGLPAHLVAEAVRFGGGAYAVDAACASSLYAIKLACDRLHDGDADIALAGGVNHADDLFLHGGFSALRALSPSGQSRPFHRDADGLVPAQGAAMLVLMRVEDAVRTGRPIFGVIRGVGLSNDGRSRGLMVPAEEGQIRALRAAYAGSGLSPSDISLVECHATGTPVGDGAEIRSMREVFAGARALPIGSLKSNLGHLITASGAAAVIKVLAAMRHGVRPPTRDTDAPLDELADGMFRPLRAEEPWTCEGPRRAAISNFGFGGNNAHLLLEEWTPSTAAALAGLPGRRTPDTAPIAVVAQAVRAGAAPTPSAFDALALDATATATPPTTQARDISVEAAGLRFPPTDLRASLAQQLLLVEAAQALDAPLARLPHARTSVLVGMQCDAEVARHAIRWRGARTWLDALPAALRDEPLSGAGVIGCMPNIVANRLSHQLDLRGPSFAVSAEEASGTVALALGVRALRAGEIDAAVIGAVDLAAEPVQAAAARALLPAARHTPGDAAVLLVLKRHEDALRDGDAVLALVDADIGAPAAAVGDERSLASLTLALTPDDAGLTPRFGHAHAASGLLHVAAAITACAHHALPSRVGPMPWLPARGVRAADVTVTALGGTTTHTRLTAADTASTLMLRGERPRLGTFAADTREALLTALATGDTATRGALRVAITADSAADYTRRLERAHALVASGRLDGGGTLAVTLDDGIHYGSGTLEGELSFVFTGAAGAYPHMGRDLALALPELVDRFAARAGAVREAAGWVYGDDPALTTTPADKLWGASYLCQLHAELTRGLLAMRPSAAIGYCSGETNSLFALGAWGDLDGFRDDIAASLVYERELCGELRCLKSAWQLPEDAPAAWSTWRIRATVAEVRAALVDEARVRLVIINAPTDVVIAGDPEGCARVGAHFGRKASRTPGYDFIMHCTEAREYESRWRALHTRPTADVPGVRFYTHATLSSYAPTREACADALTGQAMNTVDFPALVERAYADGVRVFVEHGPHAGCTKWIGEVLGDRPHLAVALDRYGQSSLLLALEAAARLFAAGVDVDTDALVARLAPAPAPALAASPGRRALPLTLPAHPDAIPPRPPAQETNAPMNDDSAEWLPPAPRLAPTLHAAPLPARPAAANPVLAAAPSHAPHTVTSASVNAILQNPILENPILPNPILQTPPLAAPTPAPPATTPVAYPAQAAPSLTALLAAQQVRLAELHQAFLRQQVAVQSHFTSVTLAPLAAWVRAGGSLPAAPVAATPTLANPTFANPTFANPAFANPTFANPALPAPTLAAPTPVAARPAPSVPAPASWPPAAAKPAAAARPATPSPAVTPPTTPNAAAPKAAPAKGTARDTFTTRVTPARTPNGPAFTRAQLEVLSSGEISSVFGPLFAQQDGYTRQVRMPEPPLLLADRVLGIEGEPGTMGTGTIWTETDVTPGAWYLHEGRMPAGVMVESGQADLLLISWLGADFLNQSERVYRLLGCELRSHGPLPQVGETLHYEICVDGHAELDGIRMFFFHYDCWVNGTLRMSVRGGQAGFFTDGELANSAGVLWSAETAEPCANPRLDPPVTLSPKRAFSAAELDSFVAGRIGACFGPGFERADTHTRTPVIAGGKMRLLDEVTHFDPAGGPWKRGYLRARLGLTPESWFFAGHFKNDPCMPGTLMLEGGLQAMQIVLTALGHTLGHDGSRFEPAPDHTYSLRCRGQATPSSKEVVYEIFVEEIHGGAVPTIYADILGSVDGRKAFHCKRMALRLVPAWPLDTGRLVVDVPADERPVAVVDGFRFDYASLLACAWGAPSTAFGPMYARFDSPRRVARLPGPPYHFMSRVSHVEGPIGGMQVGSVAVIDYDVPRGEWYVEENNARAMPFAVMLETALQPCGWLASYVGGALGSEENLYFRNLDGTGTQHREIPEDIGTVTTTTRLTNISTADSTVIMSFDVVMRAGDEDLYTLKTVFGFFPGDTMANQAGLPMTAESRASVAAENAFVVDLTTDPAPYCEGTLCLARERLPRARSAHRLLA